MWAIRELDRNFGRGSGEESRRGTLFATLTLDSDLLIGTMQTHNYANLYSSFALKRCEL